MNGFSEWLKDKLLDIKDDLAQAHKSLTIWFNVVVLPALVACWPQIWESIPQLANILPTDKYQTLLAIGTIVNTMLRFRTSTALRNK